MKTLIEIHAIQNFAPSNLNRDDTGAPKDAIFGGVRRARISSQCLKRAIRQHFAEMIEAKKLNAENLASRTKRVMDAIIGELKTKGHSEDEAAGKVRLAFSAMGLNIKEDGKTEYLLFLGKQEISRLAEILDTHWDSFVAGENSSVEGKKAGKGKKDSTKLADPELKKALDRVLDGGKALDLALFGRMLADMPDKNQDAACQVAHAISTHGVDREFDFYTAVDDLKPEDAAGADMMGTVEFNSACFYRYAVVDWEKLVQNLQGDVPLATEGLNAFLDGFVISEPTGKQNTFAAHNPPEFVAVSVRQNTAPRSLANAFESPVHVTKQQSLTQISVERLVAQAQKLQAAYGGDGETFVMDLSDAKVSEGGVACKSLEELLGKVSDSLKSCESPKE
ncbi:MAG: type I-E CRISPR-associated protein Cas7/Cse4/CasC [Lentisphaeria bacterium]